MRSLLLCALAIVCGCSSVDVGHIGIERGGSGFGDDLLAPGWYVCGPSCKVVQMETSDIDHKVKVNVLCADSLNFGFDVNILAGVDTGNPKSILKTFEMLKPEKDDTISAIQLFNTYIASVVQEEARKAVSRYQASEIVGKQSQVMEEIKAAVYATVKEQASVVSVKRVTISDLSFPDVITQAQTIKAQRHVEIETAHAEGDKMAAQAEAKLRLSQIEAQRRIIESQGIADANHIIGQSITPGFIVFIVPVQDAANRVLDMSKLASGQAVMDAALLSRIQSAQGAVEKAAAAKAPVAPSAPAPASK